MLEWNELKAAMRFLAGGVLLGILIVVGFALMIANARADEAPAAVQHNKALMTVTIVEKGSLDIMGATTRLFPTSADCHQAMPKVYAALHGSLPPQYAILIDCAHVKLQSNEPVPPSTSL